MHFLSEYSLSIGANVNLGQGETRVEISSEILEEVCCRLSIPINLCSSSVTPKIMCPPFVFAKATTDLSQLTGLVVSNDSL